MAKELTIKKKGELPVVMSHLATTLAITNDSNGEIIIELGLNNSTSCFIRGIERIHLETASSIHQLDFINGQFVVNETSMKQFIGSAVTTLGVVDKTVVNGFSPSFTNDIDAARLFIGCGFNGFTTGKIKKLMVYTNTAMYMCTPYQAV